jgi:hypothetical protein
MRTISWGGRAVSIALFLLAVLTVLLLTGANGSSVALGIAAGLIVGLLLAVVGILFFVGSRGGVTWSTSSRTTTMRPDDPALAEVREMAELQSIDLGDVLEVRSVLQASEAGGLRLQLVSVERCAAGVRLSIDVRALPGSAGPGPFAEVRASDDVGTSYRSALQVGGGGTPMRVLVALVPAAPSAARRLALEITRFYEPFGGSGSTPGPWRFEVPLA